MKTKQLFTILLSILTMWNTFSYAQNCNNCPQGITCIGDPPITTYFNTGSDGITRLPINTLDPKWQYSSTGKNGPYTPAYIIGRNTAWYESPFHDATWIAHSLDGAHQGNKTYHYKIEFDLPCFSTENANYSNPGSYCLHLDYFADNTVTKIWVNDIQQFNSTVDSPYTHFGYVEAGKVSTNICDGFKPGKNILIVEIKTSQSHSGFLVQSNHTSLPIRIASFTTVKEDNVAVLHWITNSETNNAGFEIQRSNNGIEWENIGYVNSAGVNGNSSTKQEYSFVDTKPYSGKNYYRLKQIDKDLTHEYSKINVVDFGRETNSNYYIYPNPTNDIVNITGLNGTEKISVFNSLGKNVLTQSAENAYIDLSHLPKGLYIFTIQDRKSSKSENFKIIKE